MKRKKLSECIKRSDFMGGKELTISQTITQ